MVAEWRINVFAQSCSTSASPWWLFKLLTTRLYRSVFEDAERTMVLFVRDAAAKAASGIPFVSCERSILFRAEYFSPWATVMLCFSAFNSRLLLTMNLMGWVTDPAVNVPSNSKAGELPRDARRA